MSRRLLVHALAFVTVLLGATPGIARGEPVSVSLLGVTPGIARDEPVSASQWHLALLGVQQAHAIAKGDGVTVAVIDTGVDASHPDLAGSILPGNDLSDVGTGDGRQDIDGHGTRMAGLIAAHGSALGIAPAARILPVRDAVTEVNARKLPAAIDWAVMHGAKVVSLSISIDDTPELKAAVTRALAADAVVVAAAGNKGKDAGVRYPAAYDGVIAAAGIGRDGQHAEVSVVGSSLVLAAPAVDIVSTATDGAYGTGTGTSDAAAIIAGAAALVRSKYPNLSGKEVYHRLTATADDKGAPGRDPEYGYGVVNLVKALTAEVPPVTNSLSPTGAAAPPPGGSFPARTVLIGAAIVVLLAAAGIGFALFRRRTSAS